MDPDFENDVDMITSTADMPRRTVKFGKDRVYTVPQNTMMRERQRQRDLERLVRAFSQSDQDLPSGGGARAPRQRRHIGAAIVCVVSCMLTVTLSVCA